MSNKDRFKLFCLALLAVGGTLVLVTDNPAVHTSQAFSAGPGQARTGAPGETTCMACHRTLPANLWPNEFIINAPETYTPGQTYQITVEHRAPFSPTRLRWGFELTALTLSDNTKAGELASTSDFTSVLNGTGAFLNRQYIRQTSAGTFAEQSGGASWTFNWTAPATDVGPVRFYAAGNQANNNGANTGDQIYTTEVTALPAGIASAEGGLQ